MDKYNIKELLLENNNTKIPILSELTNGAYDINFLLNVNKENEFHYGIYRIPDYNHYFLLYRKSDITFNVKNNNNLIYDIGSPEDDNDEEFKEFLKSIQNFLETCDKLNKGSSNYNIKPIDTQDYIIGWYLNKNITLKDKEREIYYNKEKLFIKNKIKICN